LSFALTLEQEQPVEESIPWIPEIMLRRVHKKGDENGVFKIKPSGANGVEIAAEKRAESLHI